MTGTANTKAPTTDAEWARNTQDRVVALEQPSSLRAGEWVLSTDRESGNLIASNANGGRVVLATPPDVTEATADDTSTGSAQIIKVSRIAADGIDTIAFDSVDFVQGDWTFTAPGTDITIPADAIYCVIADVHQSNVNSLNSSVVVRRNGGNILVSPNNRDVSGTSSSAQSHSHGAGSYGTDYAAQYLMVSLFQFIAGDIITVFVNNTGGVGTSGATSTVATTLTIAEWKGWE